MKLSLNWICDFINLSDISPKEISERLTLSVCELEGWEHTYTHLEKAETVTILSIQKHPNADRLQVCKVRSRAGEHQIVCGASNVYEGMRTVLSPPGTKLPLQEIRKAKIRGIESEGMLCSSEEMILTPLFGSQEGIIDLTLLSKQEHPLIQLDEKNQKEQALSKLLPCMQDIVFEIDNKSITHRPDLWSHFGFARELSALFDRPLLLNPLDLKKNQENCKSKRALAQKASVQTLPTKEIVVEKGAAFSYYGIAVGNIKVTPSPLWIQCRLINIGQNPINNVVDASNYVMFETGQPNHSFDLHSLKGNSIYTIFNPHPSKGKTQDKDTAFITLDGNTISPPLGSILIQDKDIALGGRGVTIALGGIMGGKLSSVKRETSALFLESACFPREKIRRTITLLGSKIRTHSAQRFEKGQDPSNSLPALYRIIHILQESCTELYIGKLCGKTFDSPKKTTIRTSLSFVQKRIGFLLPKKEILGILSKLNFKVISKERSKGTEGTEGREDSLEILVPSYRSQYDISIAEDIVEEIGRTYGYQNIEPKAPPIFLQPIFPNPKHSLIRKVKDFFSILFRFSETLNYSFSTPKNNRLSNVSGIVLKNSPVSHKNELRISLIPGLLEQVAVNQDRFPSVGIFEVGKVYLNSSVAGERTEETRVSFAYIPEISGKIGSLDHSKNEKLLPFLLEIREKLLFILSSLMSSSSLLPNLSSYEEYRVRHKEDGDLPLSDELNLPFLHPKGSLVLTVCSKKLIGSFGILHPSVEKQLGIKRPCIIGDLNLEELCEVLSKEEKTSFYHPPSVHPASLFEISLLLSTHEGSHLPVREIQSMNIPEIESIRYLTEYTGPPLLENKKSVSYEICCSRHNSSLSGSELQVILDQITNHLRKRGFPLRT